jgi:hypothetical protein
MQPLPIEVESGGHLKLAEGTKLPPDARLAVLALRPDEPSSAEIVRLAALSGSLDFLANEPDLYTDADIEPANRNPNFIGNVQAR